MNGANHRVFPIAEHTTSEAKQFKTIAMQNENTRGNSSTKLQNHLKLFRQHACCMLACRHTTCRRDDDGDEDEEARTIVHSVVHGNERSYVRCACVSVCVLVLALPCIVCEAENWHLHITFFVWPRDDDVSRTLNIHFTMLTACVNGVFSPMAIV